MPQPKAILQGEGERRDRFLLGVLAGKTAKQAYIDAGYKCSGSSASRSASRMLKKLHSRLEQLQGSVERAAQTTDDPQTSHVPETAPSPPPPDAIMDAVEAQRRLSAIARMEPVEEVVLGDGGIIYKRPSFKDAIRAIETLGRYQGSFVAKQEIDLRGAAPVIFKDDLTE